MRWSAIPQLCINVPIVIACLAYVGWLSPVIFVCGMGCRRALRSPPT